MRKFLDFPYRAFKFLHLPELSFYSNAFYLMIDSVSGALLGFIFWFVAARRFNTESVGLSSALISAVTLLAFIAGLGMDDGIIRFLPSAVDKDKFVNNILTLTGITGIIISAIFILGIPFWSPALTIIHENPVYAVAFTVLVTISVYYAMLGAVCISYKRADFQLTRSLILNLGKLLILTVVASILGRLGILFSWGTAMTLATIFCMLYLLPKLIRGYRPGLKLEKKINEEMIRFSLTNYLSGALWSMPLWILPLMIINILGATSTAQFFIGQSVGAILVAIPSAISTSIYAEGSNKIESLKKNVKRGILLIALLLIPSEIILLVFGGFILSLFGSDYTTAGIFTLRCIALSAIPFSITFLYLTVSQVEKHLLQIIWICGSIAFGILVFGYVFLKIMGINGAAIAWLVTHTIVALVVTPFLFKYMMNNK